MQNIVATDGINAGWIFPTQTTQFALGRFAPGGNGFGKFIRQIEIASDTLLIPAIETKNGLGGFQIERVFDLTQPGNTVGSVKDENQLEGFQFFICLLQADRVLDAPAFLQAVFGTRSESVVRHHKTLLSHNGKSSVSVESLVSAFADF